MEIDKLQDKEVPISDEKVDKYDRRYAEEAVYIKRSDFGRGILIPVKNFNDDYLSKGQKTLLTGKKGTFVARGLNYDLRVDYSVDHNRPEHIELNIRYQEEGNQNPLAIRGQTIILKQYELNYGTDFTFVCPLCGTETCKILYLSGPNSYFGCRKCKHIKYGLCYLKKEVPHQKHPYFMNRLYKIIREWPDIKRYFYNGSMTKKTMRLANMYVKAGMEVPDNFKSILMIDEALLAEQVKELSKTQVV